MRKIKFYLTLFTLSTAFSFPVAVKASPSPTSGMVIVSEENTQSEKQGKEKTKTHNFRKNHNKRILKKKKTKNIKKNKARFTDSYARNAFCFLGGDFRGLRISC